MAIAPRPSPDTPVPRPARRRALVLATVLLAAASAGLLASCASSPAPAPPGTAAMPALPTLDLPRFMGRWWVVANIPYFAERGKLASSDTYALREDGAIDVTYSWKKTFEESEERSIGARARPVEGSGGAHWRQRFFGIFSVQLHVLEVDADYTWALLATPDRELAWVFAREPLMDDAEYARLAERLRAHGVDPAALRRVPQAPEQVGRPGFQ